MDDVQIVYSHSQLRFPSEGEANVREFLSKQCDEHDIHFDEKSLTGVWQGRILSLIYEWEFEEANDEEGCVVHQEVKTSPWLLKQQLRGFWPLGVLFTLVYYIQNTGTIDIYAYGFAVILGGLLLLLFIIKSLLRDGLRSTDVDSAPDPLIDGLNRGIEYQRYNTLRVISLLQISTLGTLLVAAYVNRAKVTVTIAGASIVFTILLFVLLYADRGRWAIRLLKGTFIGELQISGIAQRYATHTIRLLWILAFLPAASLLSEVFINRHLENSDEIFRTAVSEGPFNAPFLDEAVALILLIGSIDAFRDAGDEDRILGYVNFQRRRVTNAGRLIDSLAVLASSILIYFALETTLTVLFGIEVRQFPDQWITLSTTETVVGLLALYFPAGIIYQYVSRQRRIHDILENSTRKSVSVAGYSSQFRVYDSNELFAASFSTWKQSYIVVSERYVSLFDDDRELAAIVAHEEGHIQNGDTRLCNLVTILSTVTLVGQNVLYAMVDFQYREERADDYAKEAVGAQWLTSALLKIAMVPDEKPAEAFGVSFTPRFDPSTSGGLLDDSFALFFGEFALNDHPDYQRRTQRLHESEAERSWWDRTVQLVDRFVP
ncbi:M48 family metallopeptidase [Halosimplex salinum]|uniref:M48 family metallopeptidase n=1 Tax=Halosimplex salinum TaxID=1710538 RepID=UPI000F47C235|nr:M48 family metalloprotease [Halosimplex salinum]